MQKVRDILKTSFDCAVRNNLISANVVRGIHIPKNALVKKVKALTYEQQKTVEDLCRNDVLGHLMIFLLQTGLRRKEIVNLKWADFDPQKNCIYVRESKTDAGERMVPLIGGARRIIDSQNKSSEYIFLNTKGNPISYTVLKRLYERIREKSGISNLTNHVCRHTFATRLVEKEANIKAVSKLMGHTSVAFTMKTYVTADEDYLREQIELLEDINR